MIKVLMIPTLRDFQSEESGIKRVVESYHKYANNHGIKFVDCKPDDYDSYDVFAVHAGSYRKLPDKKPIVAHLHGLYWTDDYDAAAWEWAVNASVIATIRRADIITVPSDWVAETIRRDARIDPVIIPHGIEWEEWQHDKPWEQYTLWNKNRAADVCNPYYVGYLADQFPDEKFVTTFRPLDTKERTNLKITGLLPHDKMKDMIQRSGIYLSTAKETFGIGVLEAMASGVPVLGFKNGGNAILIEHGQTGYLAVPNNLDDLVKGYEYCKKFRNELGENAVQAVKKWSWDNAMNILRNTYEAALEMWENNQVPMQIDESLYKVV
jgi:glycosyltransferase involved in cell wall biosynthesis